MPFTFTLRGGSPNTNYYYRFILRRVPLLPDRYPAELNYDEVYNGMLSTNSTGLAKFFGSHQTLFGHRNNHAGVNYDTIAIQPNTMGYLELEDGTKSNEIPIQNIDNSQTG